MVIVPSVDVRAGRVTYRDGVGADEDPRELAKRYVAQGAEELHLVDLDGAERGEYANFELLAGIARDAGVPCRLAGGVASIDRARAATDAGFAGVLLSRAAFGDENILRRVSQLPGAIVEIESRDGKLAPRGGPSELVLIAKGMDARLAARVAGLRRVRALYVIDLSSDGKLGGPPLVLMEELRSETGREVAYHTGGGVRSVEDIRALAEWGAASVVIGRAFLEGRFTVAEAKAACA